MFVVEHETGVSGSGLGGKARGGSRSGASITVLIRPSRQDAICFYQ